MKSYRCLFFFILIFTFLCGAVPAQENKQSLSKDKAFILEETSPEKAIEILGKPMSDKTGKIDVLYIDEWISEKFKKEKYRFLSFDRLEDLGKVQLTFYDEKLIAITFSIEKDIPAARLSAIYKVQFIPVFNKFDIRESVGEFDKLPRNVSSAKFPRQYYLVGTGKTSVITAKIFSATELAGNIREENSGRQNVIRTKPITGKVTEIQILSRKLLK